MEKSRLYVGENGIELQSRASSYTQASDVSKSASALAVKSKGIHYPGRFTAEQLEIIRLQSENFDLRRICEKLQDTVSNSVDQVTFDISVPEIESEIDF